jgi:CBS domain containing-hemolysin-like protein
MGLLIFVVFLILCLSALVSAAEAAIYCVPLHRAQILAEEHHFGGKVLLELKKSMERPITTLLAIASLISVAGSFFVGFLTSQILSNVWLSVFAGILTFVIMIFGEMIPKRLAERHAEKVALAFAPAVDFISHLFAPISWFIKIFTHPFLGPDHPKISEAEIKFLVKEAEKEGSIEVGESQLIQKIFHLNDIMAADIMTPKPLTTFIDGSKTVGEMSEFIKKANHSRLPVFENDTSNIVGIVHQRNLLEAIVNNELDQPIKNYAWEAMMVPESRLIDDLLRDMREKRNQLAIVVSDYGNVVGVVGIEDILEELVGEIIDEKDVMPEMIKRVAKNEIVTHGQTRVPYINHFFNTDIKSKKTLNGYLLEQIGELPEEGRVFEENDLKFIMESVGPRMIDKVRIIKKLEGKSENK